MGACFLWGSAGCLRRSWKRAGRNLSEESCRPEGDNSGACSLPPRSPNISGVSIACILIPSPSPVWLTSFATLLTRDHACGQPLVFQYPWWTNVSHLLCSRFAVSTPFVLSAALPGGTEVILATKPGQYSQRRAMKVGILGSRRGRQELGGGGFCAGLPGMSLIAPGTLELRSGWRRPVRSLGLNPFAEARAFGEIVCPATLWTARRLHRAGLNRRISRQSCDRRLNLSTFRWRPPPWPSASTVRRSSRFSAWLPFGPIVQFLQ